MTEITQKDNRYTPITQKRWCCVAACILMIMERKKISLIDQEELAWHLGLIVPKDEVKNFKRARTGPRPPAGYGTQIFKKEFYPDVVFKKIGIPLKMIFHSVDDFKSAKNLEKFLEEIIANDRDAAVCFDYGKLHSTRYVGGHICLVDKILPDGEILLIDPLYDVPKFRTVKILKLFEAMKKHGPKNMGGVWEFI